jgi:cyclically-permuted mutarotase family protein
MRRLSIQLYFIIMFFPVASYAQKRQGLSMQWKITTMLPAAKDQAKALGFAGPVAGVHENVMIVAGGANFPDSMPWQGGKKKYYDDVYVYKKENNKTLLFKKTSKLPSSIAYAASCSSLQGVVYAGGENGNGISNKVFLLKWDKIKSSVIIKDLPDLPVGLTNASATVNGNMVYIAGGETTSAVSDQFFCLDLSNSKEGWKLLPSLPKPVSHAVLAVQTNSNNQCIYLAGGRKKNANGISDLYSSVYEFDLKKNEWKEKSPLPYALSAGTSVTTGSAYLLMFGGDRGNTFHKTESLIVTISSEKDEIKKQELIQQKNHLQASHPGFSKDVLLYNTITDEWTKIGTIPFDSPVTTVAFKWNSEVIIPGGEIRAGVRTPHILSGKIYFNNK